MRFGKPYHTFYSHNNIFYFYIKEKKRNKLKKKKHDLLDQTIILIFRLKTIKIWFTVLNIEHTGYLHLNVAYKKLPFLRNIIGEVILKVVKKGV